MHHKEQKQFLLNSLTIIIFGVTLGSPYINSEIIQGYVKELYSIGIPVSIILALLSGKAINEKNK